MGGKSRVADLVWERFGDVDNYCEPFAGSMAVLLRRPAEHFGGRVRKETCNDANHFLVNFWRAVQSDPDQVAKWCDWPVNEADLHARHKFLVRSQAANDFRKWMAEDPHHYDAKFAGWWCWGACCWIGGAWCHDGFVGRNAMPQIDVAHGGHRGPRAEERGWTSDHKEKMPELLGERGDPAFAEQSVQVPELAVGRGGHHGRPQLTDTFDIGRGVNGGGAVWGGSVQVPHMTNAGQGVDALPGGGTCDSRRAWLVDWMRRLSDRLRNVRTCYGHWDRICDSDSTMTRLGVTGVFLDPPYPANRSDTGEKSREANLYATDKGADLDALRDEVLAWCARWGAERGVRLAVCGYEGDGYEKLADEHGWTTEAWSASGGYGNQRRAGKGKSANADRERIWFSPGCLTERTLFDDITEAAT